MQELKGRVAVVTGAAGGIGRALAKCFAAAGMKAGLDPEEVGQKVLEAIRREQFYVITHDYNHAIEERMRNILAAQNPEPRPPTPEFLKIIEKLMGRSTDWNL